MRIVSGMRPTGKLHIGHYVGVLKKWLELAQEHESLFFVADWHALSTSYEEKLNLEELSLELIRTWMAVGIDPEKSLLFIQSAIKEHAELYLLLNMITPIGWLERNPTYKDQLEQIKHKEIHTAGFLTYPVLQTADIVLYEAEGVPIGEDQRPHLEIAREIVRRFHHLFGCKERPIFKEPQEILSPTPRLLGIDGRKMSKSYGNAIYLDEEPESIWQKVRAAKTDPQRIRKNDPGNPEVCVVYGYHKAFSDPATIAQVEEGCRSGTIGCVECKRWCAAAIDETLAPIREKRERIGSKLLQEVVAQGNAQARKLAQAKMEEVNSTVLGATQ
ncbi:MAG: tryptophan--tRNA ligase [Nitratiruptor sp.]|nr:tryptophan--tRNA ligase [Nitratiruptor sp.]NPA83689.1 tryptophan--tRNA ligase [Campylobacterota bacterium]